MPLKRSMGYVAAGAGAFALACVGFAALQRDRARALVDDLDVPIATGANDWAAPIPDMPAEPSPAVQPEPERERAEALEAEVAQVRAAFIASAEQAAARLPRLSFVSVEDGVDFNSAEARHVAPDETVPVFERRLEVEQEPASGPARRETGARLYAFAAVKGDAAGRVLRGRTAKAAARPRWAVEKIANIGDVQLGVGWRKGAVQASLALVDREIEIKGYETRESFVAFTVSVKPRKPKRVRAA